MKKTLLIAITLLSVGTLFSQITPNCNSDFWTITFDGYIQQWSLTNGMVSGGDTILSGGGNSLSYCGDSNAPTFYSNNYNPVGIMYYDTAAGWVDIPTAFAVDHNGGHLNDQYYRVEGAVIQIVMYWDGANLLTVDSLMGEFFVGVQDIAVDTFGQAWIFTGSTFGGVDSLKVYNQNGKIKSYSMHFDYIAYGSFFLNDTLYIGTDQDTIFPVILGDSTAALGDPIPFPSGSYTDMASCQKTASATAIDADQQVALSLYPNPTEGTIRLRADKEIQDVSVYNALGQNLSFKRAGDTIDISDQAPGLYFVKISGNDWAGIRKVLKL